MTETNRSWPWRLRALVAVLWFVVILLAAEFGLQLWSMRAVAGNPYVLAREAGQPWPNAEESLSDLVHQVAPADPMRLPVPSEEDYLVAHAPYVLWMDRGFVSTYASNMERAVVFLTRDVQTGTLAVDEWYPQNWLYQPQLDQTLAAEREGGRSLIELAGQLNATRPVGCLPLGPNEGNFVEGCVVQVPGAEDAVEELAFLQLPISGVPEGQSWKRLHMSYKPHADQAGVAQVYGNVPEFRLNNFGFRDDDVRVPKPEGVVRIVCIGASTTEEGPTNGFTYPNLSQRFLEERFGEGRVEVINAGVSGTQTLRERISFPNYLMMEPDLVVFYNGVNDLCYVILRKWAGEIPAWRAQLARSKLLRLFDPMPLLPDEAVMRAELRDLPGENIRAMAAYAREQGVDVAVCSFAHPDWDDLDADERVYYNTYAQRDWTGIYFTFRDYLALVRLWNEEIRAMCEENGLRYIPVAEQLTGGTETFGDICHMKDRGIEQKARIVAEYLAPYVAEKLGE